MAVTEISSSSYVLPAASQSPATSTKQTDPANFMQMLLAQMSHQNPMEPMKDGEMMGQMAQLNSLQELQMIKLAITELAASNRTSYAASLVGKSVTAEENGRSYAGKVTGITLDGKDVQVHIGSDTVSIDSVTEIQVEG